MYGRSIVLAAAIALAPAPAAAGSCEDELARQSASAGIPAPLAQALAASLAIGPGGAMHPFAVESGGRAVAERSAQAAAREAARLLRQGASEVRVGCLGTTLMPGMDESGILRALDPAANVASALSGIAGDSVGIGDALEAIQAGAPPPPPEPRETLANAPAAPTHTAVPRPARNGSIGGRWSLFTDGAARPLANP